MDRDTAARALADAYTAAREAFGMDHAPGVALDTGRLMEQWLHDRGFQVQWDPMRDHALTCCGEPVENCVYHQAE